MEYIDHLIVKYDNEMCINDTFKKLLNDLSILYNKNCPLITNKLPRKHFLFRIWNTEYVIYGYEIWNTIRKCIFKKKKNF